MFRWYAGATKCYAYLSDVDSYSDSKKVEQQISESRWFTRGWTLQELIAPSNLGFYDREWRLLGDKMKMLEALNQVTGIDEDVLRDRKALRLTSVAKRMSWAAGRTTSRVEDRAYSLLGIFDVNMPMLYGEGQKAFQRLQEEIVRTSVTVDHSILAWMPLSLESHSSTTSSVSSGLLSPSPDGFMHAYDVVSWDLPQTETFEFSQRGLKLTSYVRKDRPRGSGLGDETVYTVALNCRYIHNPSTRITLRVLRRPRVDEFYLESPREDTAREDETPYDRDWVQEHATSQLVSLDASSVRTSGWTRTTLTLARQSFLFPEHGPGLHFGETDHDFRTGDAMRYAERLLLLSPQDGLPGLRGSLTIQTREWSGRNGVSVVKTTLHIRVMPPNVWTRPPPLFVHTRLHDSDSQPFVTGETRQFPTEGNLHLKFSVAARYVNLVGELLWSIMITPAIPEDATGSIIRCSVYSERSEVQFITV